MNLCAKVMGNVLVKGESDWVFMDVKTGMPKAIPQEVEKIFTPR
jgi:acyl-CoA thioesterase FadM